MRILAGPLLMLNAAAGQHGETHSTDPALGPISPHRIRRRAARLRL